MPRLLLYALLAVLPIRAMDLAEAVSVAGSVHWYNAKGKEALPCRQWPVWLLRTDSSGRAADTLRARTDSYGQYAFYGLPAGEYALEIPKGFGRSFRKTLRVPAKVDPIVLPPPLPALADSSAYPIRVESDYEKLGKNRYRFRMRVKVPAEWKPLVRKAVYFMNHSSFQNKYLTGRDSSMDFEVSYLGWGCLNNVTVEVFFAHETWTVEFPFCDNLREKAQARKNNQPPVK